MLYIIGLAKFIKSIDSNIKIAIGGPQATFMPSAAFAELPDVDYICRSPGEITLLGIAQAIENGTPFLNLSGVSYKDDDGAVLDTPELEGYTDLDRYPSAYLNDVFDYSRMREAIMLIPCRIVSLTGVIISLSIKTIGPVLGIGEKGQRTTQRILSFSSVVIWINIKALIATEMVKVEKVTVS